MENQSEYENDSDSDQDKPNNIRIGFLGPEGTYSHQVSTSFKQDLPVSAFKSDLTISHKSHSTITEAFNSTDRESQACLIPFENSTYGLVGETIDNLVKLQDVTRQDAGKSIRGEARLPVGHSLLVNQKDYQKLKELARDRRRREGEPDGQIEDDQRELNDEELSGIGRVYSHEQALGQCSNFLTTICPQTIPPERRIKTNSTALASQIISGKTFENGSSEKETRDGDEEPKGKRREEEDIISASIASEICQEVYGLKIARRNIQDRNDNTTRFFLISKNKQCDKLTSKTLPDSTSKLSVREDWKFGFNLRSNPKVKVRTLFLLTKTRASIQMTPDSKPLILNLLNRFLKVVALDVDSPELEVLKIDRLSKRYCQSALENEGQGEGEKKEAQGNGNGKEEEEDVFSTPYLIEVGSSLYPPENINWESLEEIKSRMESLFDDFMEHVDERNQTKARLESGVLRNLGSWIY